jgi:hypothetical protein
MHAAGTDIQHSVDTANTEVETETHNGGSTK